MDKEKLETKFDKSRYKISLVFKELVNFFRKDTRSRVKRTINLVQEKLSEKERADSLDKENKELKNELLSTQISLGTAESTIDLTTEELKSFKESAKQARAEAEKVPGLQNAVANLTRKLSANEYSPKEVEIKEKILAAEVAIKAMKEIEKTRKQLQDAGDEMEEIVRGLTSSFTERWEMPLIIEASHFKKAEKETIALQQSLQTFIDKNGDNSPVVGEDILKGPVELYLNSIKLRQDPTQWNEAFEEMLKALGAFQTIKTVETLMVSEYEEESQGITPEQQQSINLLKVKNPNWIEDTKKGEWLKDFYEVLGVSKESTTEEIKTAYKRGARKYHPDKNGGEETAKFTAINSAHKVLKNEDLRKDYDHYYNIFF